MGDTEDSLFAEGTKGSCMCGEVRPIICQESRDTFQGVEERRIQALCDGRTRCRCSEVKAMPHVEQFTGQAEQRWNMVHLAQRCMRRITRYTFQHRSMTGYPRYRVIDAPDNTLLGYKYPLLPLTEPSGCFRCSRMFALRICLLSAESALRQG